MRRMLTMRSVLYSVFGLLLVLHLAQVIRPDFCPIIVHIKTGIQDWNANRIKQAQQAWVDSQTKQLPQVDRAVVYSLADLDDDKNIVADGFLIRPYSSIVNILNEKEVIGAEAEAIATIWRRSYFGGGGALCHDPPYGLRLYAKGELVLETSICWRCMNCSLYYGAGDYGFIGFGDEGDALLDHLQTIVTLPPATQMMIALNRARVKGYDNDLAGVVAELDKASALVPDSPRPDLARGEHLAKMGARKDAIEYFTRAIAKSPMSRAGYWSRGYQYAIIGSHNEAVKDFEQALTFDPWESNTRDILLLKAVCQILLGKTEFRKDELPQEIANADIRCLASYLRNEAEEWLAEFLPFRSSLNDSSVLHSQLQLQAATKLEAAISVAEPHGYLSKDAKWVLSTHTWVHEDDPRFRKVLLVVQDRIGNEVWRYNTNCSPSYWWMVRWGEMNTIWLAEPNKIRRFEEQTTGAWKPIDLEAGEPYPPDFKRFIGSP